MLMNKRGGIFFFTLIGKREMLLLAEEREDGYVGEYSATISNGPQTPMMAQVLKW